MAKRAKNKTLTDAQKYYQLLLYEASGGVLGAEPAKEQKLTNMTFAEKRGLLDSIIKVSQLEDKANEDEEQPSGMDIIRKQLNGNRADKRRRDSWGGEGNADAATSSEGNNDSADEGV